MSIEIGLTKSLLTSSVRIRFSVLVLIGFSCWIGACRDETEPRETGGSSESVEYATTIYPFRLLLEPIVGDRATVASLLPAGASPHTYEPRPSDVRVAARSRALFYGSPALDRWAAALGSGPRVALLDLVPDSLVLDLPEFEDVHKHGSGRDPHFWMDPLVVEALLPAIADTLCAFDADGCSVYRRNADAFSERLHAVHDSARAVTAPIRGRTVLLSHPFIQYFTERYGLRIAGVIEEMPGSEPTTRDMQRIVGNARRSGADAIVTLPQLPDRAARAVSETLGIPVLELDPIGGSRDRASYEELILHNARILSQGLRAQ